MVSSPTSENLVFECTLSVTECFFVLASPFRCCLPFSGNRAPFEILLSILIIFNNRCLHLSNSTSCEVLNHFCVRSICMQFLTIGFFASAVAVSEAKRYLIISVFLWLFVLGYNNIIDYGQKWSNVLPTLLQYVGHTVVERWSGKEQQQIMCNNNIMCNT